MSSKQVRLTNVGGNKGDAFYRYKRQEIIVAKEQIATIVNSYVKTTITNLPAISKDVGRPVNYIVKHFGNVLGTQTRYDKATHNFILNGQYTQKDLEVYMEKFVQKYVLCGHCGNPETTISTNKKDKAWFKCAACGLTTHLAQGEKMTNFISKNPPPTDMAIKAPTKGKKDEQAQPSRPGAFKFNDAFDVDISDDAIKKRKHESVLAGFGVQSHDDDVPHPVSLVTKFVQQQEKPVPLSLLKKAIRKVRIEYKLSSNEVVCLVFESFFNENLEAQIKEYGSVLSRYCSGTGAQQVILRYVDLLLKLNPSLVERIPYICNALYDAELIDDEVYFAWFKKLEESKAEQDKEKFKLLKGFIEFLSSQDEDDEDDEDDDDEEDEEEDDDEDDEDDDDEDDDE